MGNAKVNLLIAIKSNNYSDLITAYHFTKSAVINPNITISMIFAYQNGVDLLLATEIRDVWSKLLLQNKLYAGICSTAAKKRGLSITLPFQTLNMVNFIASCNQVHRVIQF